MRVSGRTSSTTIETAGAEGGAATESWRLPKILHQLLQRRGTGAQRLERHSHQRRIGRVVSLVHVGYGLVQEQEPRRNHALSLLFLQVLEDLRSVRWIVALRHSREAHVAAVVHRDRRNPLPDRRHDLLGWRNQV